MGSSPQVALAKCNEVCDMENSGGVQVVELTAKKEEEPPHKRMHGEAEPVAELIKVEHVLVGELHRRNFSGQRNLIPQLRRKRSLRLQPPDPHV